MPNTIETLTDKCNMFIDMYSTHINYAPRIITYPISDLPSNLKLDQLYVELSVQNIDYNQKTPLKLIKDSALELTRLIKVVYNSENVPADTKKVLKQKNQDLISLISNSNISIECEFDGY